MSLNKTNCKIEMIHLLLTKFPLLSRWCGIVKRPGHHRQASCAQTEYRTRIFPIHYLGS